MLNEVSFLNEYKSTVGKRRRDSPERTNQSSGFSGIPNSQPDNIPLPLSCPNYLPSINVPANNSYNNSSTVHGNEPWDFTNLMFAHMGYVQPDLNATVASQYNTTKYAASTTSTSQMGVFPVDYSILDMQDIGQGIGRGAGESSDFSLWSEIPIAFRYVTYFYFVGYSLSPDIIPASTNGINIWLTSATLRPMPKDNGTPTTYKIRDYYFIEPFILSSDYTYQIHSTTNR